MNHYETLGVPVDAEPARIRAAYLAAARRHHPDYHSGEDAATRAGHARRMQAVNEAWAVLGDAERRERYDLGLAGPDPAPAGRRAPVVPPGKGWTPRAGDDRWQEDFQGWADETEVLPEDEPSALRRGVRLVPVALFVAAVLLVLLAAATGSRGLLAAAFIALALSSGLFVMLPMFEMTRGRRR